MLTLVEQKALTAHIKPRQHQQSDAQYQWSPKPTPPWSAGGTLIQQPVTFETKVSIFWFRSKCIYSLSLLQLLCYSQTDIQNWQFIWNIRGRGSFHAFQLRASVLSRTDLTKAQSEKSPPLKLHRFFYFSVPETLSLCHCVLLGCTHGSFGVDGTRFLHSSHRAIWGFSGKPPHKSHK